MPPPRLRPPPGAWTSRDGSLGVPTPRPGDPGTAGRAPPGGADPAAPPLLAGARSWAAPVPRPGALPDAPSTCALPLRAFPDAALHRAPLAAALRPGRGQASGAGRRAGRASPGRRGGGARRPASVSRTPAGGAAGPAARDAPASRKAGEARRGWPSVLSLSSLPRVYFRGGFQSVATTSTYNKVLFPFPRRRDPFTVQIKGYLSFRSPRSAWPAGTGGGHRGEG